MVKCLFITSKEAVVPALLAERTAAAGLNLKYSPPAKKALSITDNNLQEGGYQHDRYKI